MSVDTSHTHTLFPSLLDRLVDEDAGSGLERRLTQQQARDSIVQSIVVDVANLLNTRPRTMAWPAELTELNVSLIDYGLPDFTWRDFASERDREALRLAIEKVIQKYEPRLSKVKVHLLAAESEVDNRVRFQISAAVAGMPDIVVFDVERDEEAGEFQLADGDA